jgi:muconate cycloisomerase
MKVTNVKLYPIQTPRETGAISKHLIIKLQTDEGLVGLGEMSDLDTLPDVKNLESQLNQSLIGLDVFNSEQLDAQMNKFPMFASVGFELAILDLRGKAFNLPVYQLLGGAYRNKIRVCYPIFPARDQAEAQANVERVGRILEKHGFDLFRYYGGVNLDADESFLKGVKDRYGDKAHFKSLDLSGRLDWKTAIEVIKRFEPYGFMLVESPCRDAEGKARVREAVSLPISEHVGSFPQALEFAQKKAVDIFNVAVVSRGLRFAKKIFALAEALGLKMLIGTTQELSIGTSAQAQLGASVPNLEYPSDPAGGRLYLEDVVKERVKYENGYLLVPQGPGLGMEIDEDKLKTLAI